jgi:uncharacterized protein
MRSILIGLLTAALFFGVHAAVSAAGSEGYKVGDRLGKSQIAKRAKGDYQEIGWDALIPEGWDPAKPFRNMDFSKLRDADKRAMNALALLRKAWDTAPVEPAWNGQRVRIPGFVVPLEHRGKSVTEFLLVPYFGACIHVPPPPANQIIDVFPLKPVKSLRTMDAVWVTGVLQTVRSNAKGDLDSRMGMGSAGYRMKAEHIAPYKEQPTMGPPQRR